MAHIECDFIAPSKIGETLTLSLAVKRIGRTSLTLAVDGCADDEPRVRATLVTVLASMETHRPVPFPADLKERLERYVA
jgi:4-hydroxybenzoyl-CoA thioesterase